MKLDILYGRDDEFREDMESIPFIKFPPHWYIKPIGPFCGASVRFLVTLDPNKKECISVYADLYDRLGFFGVPHWEIYPDDEGNNSRFKLNDTAYLISAIEKALLKHTRIKPEPEDK